MVNISYAYKKKEFFTEREKKNKSPINRILLFHSEIADANYKHYNKHCKHN